VAPDTSLERVIRIAAFRANLRTFLRRSEVISRKWGLTPQRYQLLLAIKGAPDGSQRLSVTALAERLQLERHTVTELTTRAEEAGLIERSGSEDDHRVVHLSLTSEGELRLMGALVESEPERLDLLGAFDDLAEAFRLATPGSTPGA
jgi:DNA-binding MarR family transcriptional regulator